MINDFSDGAKLILKNKNNKINRKKKKINFFLLNLIV